jgi:hypothetical protein
MIEYQGTINNNNLEWATEIIVAKITVIIINQTKK